MFAARSAFVGLVLTVTLTTTAPGAAGGDQGPGIVPFDIGTYNIRADRTLKQFEKGVDALKEKVQVAGLQEIAEKEKNDYLQSDEGWGYYRPDELRQNPIIWDTRYFEFASAPSTGYTIAKGREVESKTGGTELKDDTWATVVRLNHLGSGNEVSFINVHLLSGASRVGKPWPQRPRRFELLCDQVAGLIRLVKSERDRGNEVFASGDFNVGFQADFKVRNRKLPFKRFKRIDYRSIWQGGELDEKGTYENAYLDQIWATTAAARREVAYDIEQSDHFPAIGTYLLDIDLPLPLSATDGPDVPEVLEPWPADAPAMIEA